MKISYNDERKIMIQMEGNNKMTKEQNLKMLIEKAKNVKTIRLGAYIKDSQFLQLENYIKTPELYECYQELIRRNNLEMMYEIKEFTITFRKHPKKEGFIVYVKYGQSDAIRFTILENKREINVYASKYVEPFIDKIAETTFEKALYNQLSEALYKVVY